MAISDMSPALQRALAHKQRMAIAWRPYAKPAPAPVALAPHPAPVAIPLAETRSSAVVLDDAALAEWADGLTTRVGLQAELTWVGLNDGYVDAGGNDVAIPYLGLYWILGPVIKQHCFQCPEIANGSPYDPPGKGGHTIDQSPGDGGTVCGAGCKCWLEYGLPLVSVPKNYAWSNNVFPGPGKATAEIGAQQLQRQAASYSWQETMLLNPESEYLSDAQKGALDLFRAKWFAWEDVRGTLPQAPDMFAGADAAQSLQDLDTFWETLTAQQSNILIDLQEAIGVWNDATAEANGLLDASLDDGADLGGDGGDDAEQLAEAGADEAIQLFSFGRAFGGASEAGRGAHGLGSAFDSLHPRGFHGMFRLVNGGHHAGEGGQREHAGNAERAGGQRGASKEERSPNAQANRRVLRGKVNDSERTSRLAQMAKRAGSAEKSPNEGAARRSGAVKAGGRAKAKGEPAAKSARTPKEGAVKTAKAAKPQKTTEEKLVAQRATQLARAKSQNQAGYSEHLRSTSSGGMAAYRMPKAEWFGPGGPHAMQVRAAQLNLANARTLAKGDTAWKGEEHPPFSKSEFLRATLKPMNSRQQGHNPGFTTKIGETTYHIKLVQRDTALASETAIRFIKGSENAAYQAHAEQAATEIGHLLGVGEHMVDAHSLQVGNNHFVATKFQTGVKPLGNQEKGATPAKEAALFKTIGEGGAARLMLHEYLTGNGDAHAANVLTSAKTGEVKIIDFGRAFTQPGALMQGSHSPTRPVVNSWFRATAAKLGIKGVSQKLVTEAPQKSVYKAMHIPHEAVQHALGQESHVMGILHAHGLDAAVKSTQARFNVLRQLGNDTSLQHFDELQIKAFVSEGSQGRGAVDFSERRDDDAIQLFSIGGALRGLIGGGGHGGGAKSAGHGGHYADGREPLRNPDGTLRGSTRGEQKSKPASTRGHKGEAENAGHGGKGKPAKVEEKSPNERAQRRGAAGEAKTASAKTGAPKQRGIMRTAESDAHIARTMGAKNMKYEEALGKNALGGMMRAGQRIRVSHAGGLAGHTMGTLTGAIHHADATGNDTLQVRMASGEYLLASRHSILPAKLPSLESTMARIREAIPLEGERLAQAPRAVKSAKPKLTEAERVAQRFATHDDMGQKMPFTREQFRASLGHMQGVNTVGGKKGVNETGVVTLAGRQYLVKEITMPGMVAYTRANGNLEQAKFLEARNEVAAVHMAKALGVAHIVTAEAYVVPGPHERAYSVQRFEHGMTPLQNHLSLNPGKHVTAARAAAFATANGGEEGMRRLLFEHVTGVGDRNARNYLFNEKTGEMRIIDFGRTSDAAQWFAPQHSELALAVLAAHVPGATRAILLKMSGSELAPHLRAVAIPHAALQSLTSHSTAFRAALKKSQLEQGEIKQAMDRMNLLKRLDKMENPTMYDWWRMSHATGQGA